MDVSVTINYLVSKNRLTKSFVSNLTYLLQSIVWIKSRNIYFLLVIHKIWAFNSSKEKIIDTFCNLLFQWCIFLNHPQMQLCKMLLKMLSTYSWRLKKKYCHLHLLFLMLHRKRSIVTNYYKLPQVLCC